MSDKLVKLAKAADSLAELLEPLINECLNSYVGETLDEEYRWVFWLNVTAILLNKDLMSPALMNHVEHMSEELMTSVFLHSIVQDIKSPEELHNIVDAYMSQNKPGQSFTIKTNEENEDG